MNSIAIPTKLNVFLTLGVFGLALLLLWMFVFIICRHAESTALHLAMKISLYVVKLLVAADGTSAVLSSFQLCCST